MQINNDTTKTHLPTTDTIQSGLSATDTKNQINTNEIVDDEEELAKLAAIINPLADRESEFIGLEPYANITGHRVEKMTFEQWNRKQIKKNRIYKPSPFDMQTPNITFGEIKTGTKEGKDENGAPKTVSFNFAKLKEIRRKGVEVNVKVTSPAVISQCGYETKKTKSGEIRSIGVYFDMNNPHQRHFWEVTCMGIINKTIAFMLANPGSFGLDSKASVLSLPHTHIDYMMAYGLAFKSLGKIAWYPKNGDETDTESNLRMMYLNPSDYKDKEDPSKNNCMKILIPSTHGRVEISLDDLYDICAGFEKDPVTGEKIQGKKKGFECSYTWLFSRVVKTNTNSLGPKCTDLFIHRFFEAPNIEKREDKHLKSLTESNIEVDMSRYIICGGKSAAKIPVAPEAFQPMAQGSSNTGSFQPMAQGSNPQESIHPMAQAFVIPEALQSTARPVDASYTREPFSEAIVSRPSQPASQSVDASYTREPFSEAIVSRPENNFDRKQSAEEITVNQSESNKTSKDEQSFGQNQKVPDFNKYLPSQQFQEQSNVLPTQPIFTPQQNYVEPNNLPPAQPQTFNQPVNHQPAYGSFTPGNSFYSTVQGSNLPPVGASLPRFGQPNVV